MKYKLTKQKIEHNGRTLYRIQALKPFGDVDEGDLGGYIESEKNLSQDGGCWVYGDAKVYGDAQVFDDARVFGDAKVYGDALVYGDAQVYGNARVFGDAQVYDNAWVYGDAKVYGDALVYGDAKITNKVISITGPQHTITLLPTDEGYYASIGCKYMSLKDWLKKGLEVGEDEGYSDSDIEFYKVIIKGLKQVYENKKV